MHCMREGQVMMTAWSVTRKRRVRSKRRWAKAIGAGRATRDVGGKLGTIAAGAAIAEILQAE